MTSVVFGKIPGLGLPFSEKIAKKMGDNCYLSLQEGKIAKDRAGIAILATSDYFGEGHPGISAAKGPASKTWLPKERQAKRSA